MSASWPEDRWEHGRFVFGSLFDTDSSDAGGYYGEQRTALPIPGNGTFPLLHARDGFVHYPCRRAHHMHSEMEFVRRFLKSTFGEAAVGRENGYCSTAEQRKQMDR